MIYLASPYSDPDPVIREQRFRAACRATAALIGAGHMVFSPIVHSHPLVVHGLPTGWEFWKRRCREHLARCDEIAILTLPGWERSIGVQAESWFARQMAKPVRYVPPTLAHDGAEVRS